MRGSDERYGWLVSFHSYQAGDCVETPAGEFLAIGLTDPAELPNFSHLAP